MAKLPIYNQRMLELCDEWIANKKGSRGEFFDMIGVLIGNFTKYKRGDAKFTMDQVIIAAKKMNTTTDWICGLTNERKPMKELPPLERIKRAVKELEGNK